MKKILLVIAVLFIGITTQAQTTLGWTETSLDTVTDAGTTYLNQTKNSYFFGNDGTFSVYFKFLKGGGTPAGYAILEESPDGYNWEAFYGTSADSFQITNVDSAVHTWHVSGAKVTNVRLRVVGSGTQETTIQAGFRKE